MSATKEQERKALAKIKEIVESLGEDSYVSAAFDGCFEIAEDNINNDFMNSMRETAQKAEEETAKFEKEASLLKIANEALRKRIDVLTERTLSQNDLERISYILDMRRLDINATIEDAAEQIVKLADNAETVAFAEAVKRHRSLLTTLETTAALSKRVIGIINGGQEE